jgi:LysM repeat protein
MRKILLSIALLSLLVMACRLTARGGLPVATPTATLVLPTSAAAVEASATITLTEIANSPTPTSAATTTSPTPSATSELTQPTEPAILPAATPTPCPVRVEWPKYIVQQGDTLFQIAQKAGTTVEELVIANCFVDGDHIFVGQPLRVPPTLDDPGVFPTRIPDGTELIVYPADKCFSPPFSFDLGVSAG